MFVRLLVSFPVAMDMRVAMVSFMVGQSEGAIIHNWLEVGDLQINLFVGLLVGFLVAMVVRVC